MGWNAHLDNGKYFDGPDDIVLVAAELDKVRELYESKETLKVRKP